MHVGFNLLYLKPNRSGGTETYARNLIASLVLLYPDIEFTVFVNKQSQHYFRELKVRHLVCNISSDNAYLRVLFEQAVFPHIVRRSRVDILHSLGYTGPLRIAVPHVVTIHDLNYRVPYIFMSRLKRAFLGRLVAQTARAATHILTVSEFSSEQIAAVLGVERGRISVTYNAPSMCTVGRPRPEWPDAFVLTGATSAPHKNIHTVIKAFADVRLRHPCTSLICFGPRGDYHDQLVKLASSCGLADCVVFTGHVTPEELAWLYSHAQVFVFASLYEGFGLPPLEAMSFGAPVISSGCGALREVVGEAGIVLDDPLNAQELARRMHEVMESTAVRASLKALGNVRAHQFKWEHAAEVAMGVYTRLFAQGHCRNKDDAGKNGFA